ncbi:hypothetical protein AAG747_19355 [Rapidithrix thailandica]|uniref:Uncharacterized protein n=1 Tax=Rapidithrix thailandica TaxID=413964 RepID=A0AAW9S9D4_9BACT
MKYLAHLENNPDSKIISIYDVIQGLNGETPSAWEGRTYFSLWHHIPMIAKVNSTKQKPHFAFKPGHGGNKNSGGGESIEHQLSKKIISDLKSLNIKIGEIEDSIFFSEVIIEQPFEDGKYKADLYCRICKENKFGFPVNSMIIIELHLSNRVKNSKKKFYRNNNLTAIEVDIWHKIKFQGDVQKLQKQLSGYFRKQRFAKRLHDPNWETIINGRECSNELPKQEEIEAKKPELPSFERERAKITHVEQKSLPVETSPNIDLKPSELHTKPKKTFWERLLGLFSK